MTKWNEDTMASIRAGTRRAVPAYYLTCVVLFAAIPAMAEEKTTAEEPKVLTGMSIVGNSEAPKSLTIIPWKNSEMGTGKALQMAPNPLIEELSPIDKGVFMRELEFYKLSNPTN